MTDTDPPRSVESGIDPARVMNKVAWRLIPFLMLLYFVSFLDRVNVGFAALSMNGAVGISPLVYGWGAGIFFIGYFLFEVPSNLLMQRYGARLWIARIMISWGIVSAAMAFVAGPVSFVSLRFLLGLAEAGFFPGIIFYLGAWFPAAQRGKIIAAFMMAVPLSSVIGNPVSGWLLGLDGFAELAGWRWLFILEGVPAAILGSLVLVFLAEGPAQAGWLLPGERQWLLATIRAEEAAREARGRYDLRRALADPRVLALAAIYFGFVIGLYGVALWLPQIVKGFGLSNLQTGFVTAIPYVVAAIGMLVWGRHSDHVGERTRHVAVAGFVAALGLIASPNLGSPILAMAALSVAALGIYAALPVFWTLPSGFLTGTAAAGAIALINSVGNLGGFAGPYLVGWIKESTGSFSWGLMVLGLASLAAGLLALIARAEPERVAVELKPRASGNAL